MDHYQKTQIRNLIVLLSSGLVAAFLITAFFLYNYSPTGRYVFNRTLLSPDLVPALSYNDTNSKTGGMSRFVFGSIEYVYYDFDQKQWQNAAVSLDDYSEFYDSIADQESLAQVTDEVIAFFNEGIPSKIVLMARTESDASWQEMKKSFQEVQFSSNGNYFRVQLREDARGNHWAYFYRPNVLLTAHELFIGQE